MNNFQTELKDVKHNREVYEMFWPEKFISAMMADFFSF